MITKSLLTLAAASLILLPAANAAVVITVANNGTNYLDRNLLSNTTFGSLSSTNLTGGETAVDTNNSQGYIPFSLSVSDIAAISTATQVTLNIKLIGLTNVGSLVLNLYGLSNRGTDANAKTNDYSSGTLLLSSFASSSSTINEYLTLDVTSYVKSQIASNEVVAFKFAVGNGTLPNADGVINAFVFSSADAGASAAPYLSVTPVPEPGTVALCTLAGISLAIFRRRK